MTARKPAATFAVRPMTPGDAPAVLTIAGEFALDGSDSVRSARYRATLQGHGRLLVGTVGGIVVGFGGMIAINGPGGPTAMISDLFVTSSAHGRGYGRAIGHALVDGFTQRMTLASAHPAARATYRALGMRPEWELVYLRGAPEPAARAVTARPADLRVTDRPDVAGVYADARVIALNVGDRRIGHAIVSRVAAEVVRVRADHRHEAEAISAAALAVGAPAGEVGVCVRSDGTAAVTLLGSGWREVERDLFMSSSKRLMPIDVVALNPGLG